MVAVCSGNGRTGRAEGPAQGAFNAHINVLTTSSWRMLLSIHQLLTRHPL